MLLVLFGPPGCGKGTQATKLSKELGIPQLSTGEHLRKAAKEPNAKGQAIAWLMSNGYLVPDELVNHLVFEELVKPQYASGAILDGYPRTVQQAESLDHWLASHGRKLKHVIELEVNHEEIIARSAGRLYAPGSQRTYHRVFSPPKVPGKCDITGEDLIVREDDKPDVVRKRLVAYNDLTHPVLDYYRQTDRVFPVDGMAPIDDVFEHILARLKTDSSFPQKPAA